MHYKLPKVLDISDLENYAYIGLIDAISKFNLKKNIKFETYASFRIRGAIYDGVRKLDWLSRTLRAEVKKNSKDDNDWEKHNGNKTKNTGKSGFGGSFIMLSLDDPDYIKNELSVRSKNTERNTQTETVDFSEDVENSIFIRSSIMKLTAKERKIIYLYYFKGKTLKEIGEIMKVTESRISQIHKEALLAMKKNMNEHSHK